MEALKRRQRHPTNIPKAEATDPRAEAEKPD
jgi:hypothetical protein